MHIKKTKTLFLIIALFVFILGGYTIYDALWSSQAINGGRNIYNSKEIKTGISKENVIKIMGKPDSIINGRFCYLTNNDSYPYIELSFDSIGKVLEIYSPNKNKE